MNNIPDKPRGRKLSTREQEVLQDLANGLSSKQIADKYGISTSTVSNHRSHIIRKMRVANTIEAVATYMRFGKIA